LITKKVNKKIESLGGFRNLRLNDRVGKKSGKFEKTHGNGKNWFLPGKMGKTGKIAFFQNT
jgi:hypothetical protein